MALTQVPNLMLSTGAPFWDTSGNVGIGTTSLGAGYRVSIVGSAASSVPLYLHSDATNGYVYSPNPLVVGSTGAYALSLVTNNTVQMTISSAGIITGTAGNLMLVQGNSQASTSGTSIPFTGIPSWVKRITVNISGVSMSGTSNLRFRIGPVAGVETSGYLGTSVGFSATTLACVQFTLGFDVNDGGLNVSTRNGSFVFSLLDAATNTWAMSGTQGQSNANQASFIGGSKALAGTLSVLSMTTTNGTDTFDAGTINIQWE